MRNYKQFFAICKRHGLDYKELVAEHTDQRTESLRKLSDDEFSGLMNALLQLNAPARKNWQPRPGDQQRKKLIALASQMHRGKDTKAVVAHLDGWCMKQKYRKRLNDLSVQELGVMLYIFEHKVYADYLKGLSR